MAETEIHPSAIVDPGAEFGTGVFIGPYCVIHAGVRLGDGCWLQNHVTLCGPVEIGSGNRFYAYGSIGQQSQDLKYASEPTHLSIGDDNTFREFVTVHRATRPGDTTRIGSRCNFLAYSHIAHDCQVGDDVIFSNNGTLAGHVTVEDYAVIGGLSAVHQFCRVGKFALTGGCSKIVQDVPPYMVIDGNPARVRGVNIVGLQRNGVGDDAINALKQAHRTVFRCDQNLSQAIESLKASDGATQIDVQYLIAFLENSERGVIR
jgi:UDP-N-acetylglucosamine acyltransferase